MKKQNLFIRIVWFIVVVLVTLSMIAFLIIPLIS
jgi:hypothetical protein